MRGLILGGVTIAAVTYGIKKLLEEEEILNSHWEDGEEVYRPKTTNNFSLFVDAKKEFIRDAVIPFETYMEMIEKLPAEITLLEYTKIVVEPENITSDSSVYEVANELANSATQQLQEANKLIQAYLPEMKDLSSSLHSFAHIHPALSRAFYSGLAVINSAIEMMHYNIVKDERVNVAFIEKLNHFQDAFTKMQTQQSEVQKYKEEYGSLSNNERPLDFQRVSSALAHGTHYQKITFRAKSDTPFNEITYFVKKNTKNAENLTSLMLHFTISKQTALHEVDGLLEELEKELGRDVQISVGTKCDASLSADTVVMDGYLIIDSEAT